MKRFARALRVRLRGPALSPEERMQRHADHVDAQLTMRREIERASVEYDRALPGDRGNRFVR